MTADPIETVVGYAGMDGFVAIGGCDKNMPAARSRADAGRNQNSRRHIYERLNFRNYGLTCFHHLRRVCCR